MVDWVTPKSAFKVWLEEIFLTKAKPLICKAIFLMYHIWHARNNLVWEGKPSDNMSIWRATSRSWGDWNCKSPDQNNNMHCRELPRDNGEGVIPYCQVDASLFVDSGRVGFGAVLLSAERIFIAGISGSSPGLFNPKLAEAIACREAFSWLKSCNVTSIRFESDCMAVVEALTKRKADRSHTGLIIEQCHSLITDFQDFSCRHIPRSANQVSHTLARGTGSQSDRIIWDSIPPICILIS